MKADHDSVWLRVPESWLPAAQFRGIRSSGCFEAACCTCRAAPSHRVGPAATGSRKLSRSLLSR